MKIQSPKAGIGTGRAGLQAASGLFSSAGLFQKGVKTFHPNDLDPYLLFDARDSMLDASLETASFLEPVPVLKNLSSGSNQGGDAEQSVALNQPKALPLIKNPAGDLGGYLYIPNVTGNYATGPSVTIGPNETWEAEVDMVVTQWGADSNFIFPFGGGNWNSGFGLIFYGGSYAGYVRGISKGIGSAIQLDSGVTLGTPFTANYGYDGSNIFVDINGSRVYSTTAADQSGSITNTLQLNQQTALNGQGNYAIQKAKLTVNSAVVFDCDFNGSTSIRHGDTKFQAAVGGPVSLTTAGNDPITVVKKPVLRFDGVNSSLQGLFANNIDSGYMFAAFSVLGDGGKTYGRIFSVHNSASALDSTNFGFIFSLREVQTNDLGSYYSSTFNLKNDLFDDDNGDILHEVRSKSGQHLASVNGASLVANSRDTSSVDSDTFNISRSNAGASNDNVAIDLEYLALFPATITDAQADAVRNYINNRNNVFYRWDTDGYYFFDPLSLAADAPVASWNGQIVGSDNDANLTITQSTANSQPDRLAPDKDGMVVRFNDNNDHLIVPAGFVEPADGSWQVVGTSLGTFAYRVNANAVTELNLLGNLGWPAYRKTGDLYGIILLPESATGKDIEEARKLLIDRGAADASTITSAGAAWFRRYDIVEFKNAEFPDALTFGFAFEEATNLSKISTVNAPICLNFRASWKGCSSLTQFPQDAKLGTEASNVTFQEAWQSSGLTSFSALDLSNGNNFISAWQNCSALTSFPADAKLGTSAENVNFNRAWQSSGLTSFPALDLSTGTNFASAWQSSSLTSFPAGAQLGTSASNVNFTSAWQFSLITSFSTPLPTASNMIAAWYTCTSLTDFSADVFANWNPSSLTSGVFDLTWDGCTSLTAQSVENILVSIAASGQFATVDGNSGSAAIADAGIDIDYDGSGLTAATTAAITSLKSKGWSIFINSVEQ